MQHHSADLHYVFVNVLYEGRTVGLALTEEGLCRVQHRVATNPEDVCRYRESWLADFFD